MKSTCLMPAPRVGDPTPPLFHLLVLGVGVGGNTNFSVGVGVNASFSIFRYQHVVIPNAKLWCWGSEPMRGPNVNGFALQQNIGCTLFSLPKRRARKDMSQDLDQSVLTCSHCD